MALTTPFAQNGDKKEIPQNTSNGSVSFNNGFGSLYALPPEEGGLFIDRAQFNQLMFDTTSQVLENKTAIAAQANRINEVNTTLTQSINTKANQATTYTKTEVNNLVNAKANANATVNLTGNQTIAGIKTFTSNITAPNLTTMQNNLNTIFSSTTDPVRIYTSTELITVGGESTFQRIEQAIFAALRFTTPVEIRLISDISVTGDINIINVSGHHITINFNNFKLINSNPTAGNAFRLNNSSIGIIEKLNLIGYEINLANNASTILKGDVTIKAENRVGVRAINLTNGSKLSTYGNITYNTQSYNNLTPFFCEDGSILAFGNEAKIKDTTQSGALFVVATGGIMATINATIQTTCTAIANQAANIPTGNGIIFGNYSL